MEEKSTILVMQSNLQYFSRGQIVQNFLLTEGLKNSINVNLVFTSEGLTFVGTEQEITLCISNEVLIPSP